MGSACAKKSKTDTVDVIKGQKEELKGRTDVKTSSAAKISVPETSQIDEKTISLFKRRRTMVNQPVSEKIDLEAYFLSKESLQFDFEDGTESLNLCVTNILGKGGQSRVFQAFDTKNLKDYALKVPLEGSAGISEEEIQIQRKLQTTAPDLFARFVGISKLKDASFSYVVAVEEYEAATLSQVIDARKELKVHYTASELHEMMKQIVQIISALRKDEICHNDIKPDNILVESRTWNQFRMTDFGVAVPIPGYIDGELLEIEGGGYTQGYCAPEKRKSMQEAKEKGTIAKYEPIKSDIYSFGIVLKSLLKISEQEANEKYAEVIGRMMQEDVNMRYSLQEFETELNKKGTPISKQYSELVTDIKQKVRIGKMIYMSKLGNNNVTRTITAGSLHEHIEELDTNLLLIEYMELHLKDNLQPDDKKIIERLRLIAPIITGRLKQDDERRIEFESREARLIVQSTQGAFIKQVDTEVRCKDEEFLALLQQQAGKRYLKLGEYDNSKNYLLRSEKTLANRFGISHEKTAAVLHDLGKVHKRKGDFSNALQYYTRSEQIKKVSVGEGHPEYAASLHNIGQVYSKLGDYTLALEFLSRSEEIKRKVLGDEHPSYGTTLGILGQVYTKLGDYPRALDLYTRCEKIKGAALGESHPSYARILGNTGQMFMKQGNLDKALEFYDRCEKIQKRALGESHSDYASTLNRIGLIYHQKSDFELSHQFNEKALRIYAKNKVPTNHPFYKESKNLEDMLKTSIR